MVFLASVLIPGCATPPETAPPEGVASIPAPEIRVGQYWEYAVRDAYTGSSRGLYRYVVTRSDLHGIVLDVFRDGERIDASVYTAGWNGLELALPNLERWRFDPPLPAYEFPLYPGKHWRRVVRSTDPASGRSYNTHIQATVGGWRRLRVPAGEFDALEVRRFIYAGNAEFFRLQEEIVQVEWYAPAVGYVVATESNSSHLDTSRSGGGRGRPLRVRGDWLVAELVRQGAQ